MKVFRSLFFVTFILSTVACASSGSGEGIVETSCGFSYIIDHRTPPFDLVIPGLDPVSQVDVSPHSKGVQVRFRNGRARLRIESRGYYVVKTDGERRIFVFAEERPVSPVGLNVQKSGGIVADGTTNITTALQKLINDSPGTELVFPRGEYLVSGLRIPSGSRLFLEEGAVIKADPREILFYEDEGTHAFIEIANAQGVSIRGAGVIDGNARGLYASAEKRRNILVVNSSDVLVEGIISRDPARWNTHILWSRDVTIRGVKLLNDRSIKNTDGFDPDCSENVLIENCFAHCSDDCVAVKTTDRYGVARNLTGVTVRGCVFDTKKSALKVGTETLAESMSGILFEDNDIIECDRGMSLYVLDGTSIHDVIYRNNRFERNYPDNIQAPYHFYVKKRNENSQLGSIYDVTLQDCIFEQSFPNAPLQENPFGARLEVELINVIIP